MEPSQPETKEGISTPQFINPFLQYAASNSNANANINSNSNSKEYAKQHSDFECKIHKLPLVHFCKAVECKQRLLCDLCASGHLKEHKTHEKEIASLKEVLADDMLIAQLEAFTKQEESVFVALDDRYHGICASINNSFNELRVQLREILAQTEVKVLNKTKEMFLLGKGHKKWTHLKQQYLLTKETLMKTSPENQNKEFEGLLEIIEKIKIAKKEGEMNDFHEILQLQREFMDKFIYRIKENMGLLVETLFQKDKEAAQNVLQKIDPNKISYQTEVKADHKLIINAMTYIPKLDQFITASESGTLTSWNPTTLNQITSYKIHNDAINSLLFVESENLMITASKDKSIRLFPVDSHSINIQKPQIFTSHSDSVRSLLFLEGENKFASAGEDPDIRIWDLKTKNIDSTISTKGWKPKGEEMAYIKPERWIVVSGKKEIRIYDYVTRECIITKSAAKSVGSLVFLPEKRFLIAQDSDDRIAVFKVNSEKKLKRERNIKLPASLKKPVLLKCFELSDLMLVSMGTNKLASYSISTGSLIKEYETKLQRTTGISVLSKERRIIVGDAGSNFLGIFQY